MQQHGKVLVSFNASRYLPCMLPVEGVRPIEPMRLRKLSDFFLSDEGDGGDGAGTVSLAGGLLFATPAREWVDS